jgi:RimJ/RimL family protein N-acetyltransferase
VLRHDQEHLRLAPFCAVVALENIVSVRILEKLGFKFEKSFLVVEIKAAKYVI